MTTVFCHGFPVQTTGRKGHKFHSHQLEMTAPGISWFGHLKVTKVTKTFVEQEEREETEEKLNIRRTSSFRSNPPFSSVTSGLEIFQEADPETVEGDAGELGGPGLAGRNWQGARQSSGGDDFAG
jgi:hypothetical protein